jgi:peptide-methionine (S)-S-oxide reductase
MNTFAIFGGGCFWCTEAVFQMLKGVKSVVSGYAGGTKVNPTYMEVSSGKTGHAEVIKIEYDPNMIDYKDLLTVFFGSHDPTTLNRQGADVGTQYRSVIFTMDKDQEEKAKKIISEINASNKEGKPIVTEVVPFTNFYPAEGYHQNYYQSNKTAMYCDLVINPKLEKVQKQFADLLIQNQK